MQAGKVTACLCLNDSGMVKVKVKGICESRLLPEMRWEMG